MPACSTASSATSGTSRRPGSPARTFSVPTCWPLVKGATSGSGRATWVLILLAAAGRHRQHDGWGWPSFTRLRRALPDLRLQHGLVGVEQLDPSKAV
jgi:hypothetical protein